MDERKDKKVKLKTILLLWLGLTIFSKAAHGEELSFERSDSQWQVTCGQLSGPAASSPQIKYCVHRHEKSLSNDTLYYLHGRENSEKTWFEPHFWTSQLREFWPISKQPMVISVSYGPLWALVEKNGSSLSGLFEHFTKFVIPSLEAISRRQNGKRFLLGDSMGGFNSLQLFFKTDLFDKTAALCAPVYEFSPFLSEDEYFDKVKSTRVWQILTDKTPILEATRTVKNLATAFYPTEESWKNSDSILLAQSVQSHSRELYLAVGLKDPYANYEGNQKLAELLDSRNFKVEWRPQWGGHCAVDIPSLGNFFVR